MLIDGEGGLRDNSGPGGIGMGIEIETMGQKRRKGREMSFDFII